MSRGLRSPCPMMANAGWLTLATLTHAITSSRGVILTVQKQIWETLPRRRQSRPCHQTCKICNGSQISRIIVQRRVATIPAAMPMIGHRSKMPCNRPCSGRIEILCAVIEAEYRHYECRVTKQKSKRTNNTGRDKSLTLRSMVDKEARRVGRNALRIFGKCLSAEPLGRSKTRADRPLGGAWPAENAGSPFEEFTARYERLPRIVL